MESIHRSEEMCLAQLFLQKEAAYACVAELGELGLVQFRDLNEKVNIFQRKFVTEVRRCDEMERKLRFLETEIKKDGIPMLDTGENPEAPQPREMFDLEAIFEKLENELREVNQNEEMLKKNFAELTELKHILRKTQQFFDEVESERRAWFASSQRTTSAQVESRVDDAEQPLLGVEHVREAGSRLRFGLNEGEQQALNTLAQEELYTDDGSSLIPTDGRATDPGQPKGHLKFIAGVILRERLPTFERLLWRACRGNVFLRQSEITEALSDTATGLSVQKAVFIIFFQGDQLKSRIKKICEGFRASIYPCPETPQERREMSIGVMTRIEDLKTVLGQTQDHRHRVLVSAAKNVRMWLAKVTKIKAIYHTLNLFNLDQKCFIAECWCPVAELDRIQRALRAGSDESGSTVPSILNRMETSEAPPTYNRTNKFTQGFQAIVDAYGIANYREINPAPYTMVTFPFLFALMFGDLGHGFIMFAFALFMVLKEKRLEAQRIKDEIFQMFFGGRYVIFLMGLFSIYTGLIYNDAFSKSFNLFGSSWHNPFDVDTLLDENPEKLLQLSPQQSYASSPYPVGVDPVWNLAESNKLNFLNSMKMKASVIIGISQMTFGVALSYYNHKYFKSDLDIKFTFIPQLIFLSSIFIYLCLQIVAKWLFYDAQGGHTVFTYKYPGAICAPSLLIGLINMFMMKSRNKGFYREDGTIDPACHLNYWYPGQSFFESIFIPVAVGCIFVMLFAKPYVLWQQRQQRRALSGGVAESVLLGLALLAIPVMLLVKPLLLWKRHGAMKRRRIAALNRRRAPRGIIDTESFAIQQDEGFVDEHQHNISVHANMQEDGAEVLHHEDTSKQAVESGQHGANDESFGDVMVYQAIHTIEFALGCISHTASYLRLWALSLAHAQLSDVLWTMVLRNGFLQSGYVGAVLTYLIFFVFATLTVSILVLMEGLSAFLHALRLHWVEFQSKFYGGMGHAFAPFSFEKILEESRNSEESCS
uniref:V-type proton ATPase subunit a n=1 Tax=Globodera rostochiensis TaxID=31243 RepID=A0A914HU72_GLORO